MTYAETKEVMETIARLKLFAEAVGREKQKDSWDWAVIEKLEKYLEEAEQDLFTMYCK